MGSVYQIKPLLEDYACVVDLLARASMLEEAEKFIEEKMGGYFERDANVWGALLSACRIYRNVEVGKRVWNKLANLRVTDCGTYVILYNIYKEAGWKSEAKRVRSSLKELGLKKKSGCSSIEVDGVVVEFIADGCSSMSSLSCKCLVFYCATLSYRVLLFLLRFLSLFLMDCLVLTLAKLMYGDLSKFGIKRPTQGPFYLKGAMERCPVIDVGTVEMIRNKEIKVVPEISSIEGNKLVFEDGKALAFDAIIFATGFRSLANNWLEDEGHLLNDARMPSAPFPKHWKGKSGLYCAGLARRGLARVSMDAQNIAEDIKKSIGYKKKKL